MPSDRPNILLITTDQQRFDTAGSAKPPFMRTPHFDYLCREGVEFTRAYGETPVCVPSRMTIMTGQHPLTHGMLGNGKSSNILGSTDTLPWHMRRLGYQTLAVGKMHFHPQRARHGFDEMKLCEDYYNEMLASGQGLLPMRHGMHQCELEPAMATVPESMTLTSWTAEQCVQFIRERRDPTVPFFVWCSFSKPHPPFDPPEPYYSMYRNCDIPAPVFGDWSEPGQMPHQFRETMLGQHYDLITPEVIREARSAYYGLITQIDYNMGRIFAALQDMGLMQDAMIVYTSDHGEYLGDHHAGGKGFFHEPSAHVPFAMRLPQSWDDRRHGTQCDAPVTLSDVMPTILAAAGGDVPDNCDGVNLVDVARGKRESRPYVLHASGRKGQGTLGVFDGRYKYSYYAIGGVEHLFDLEADPMETRNLADHDDVADKQAELRGFVIDEARRRCPEYLDGEKLVVHPVPERSDADIRNNRWLGAHTEYCDIDVRH
jgi:arylsulfatase A-like enzyme